MSSVACRSWSQSPPLARDPRLAANSPIARPAQSPAWLWSTDGSRILWANAVGAAIFGAANAGDCAIAPLRRKASRCRLRSRGSRQPCRRPAKRGSSVCAASGRASAALSLASARGWRLATAQPSSSPPTNRPVRRCRCASGSAACSPIPSRSLAVFAHDGTLLMRDRSGADAAWRRRRLCRRSALRDLRASGAGRR